MPSQKTEEMPRVINANAKTWVELVPVETVAVEQLHSQRGDKLCPHLTFFETVVNGKTRIPFAYCNIGCGLWAGAGYEQSKTPDRQDPRFLASITPVKLEEMCLNFSDGCCERFERYKAKTSNCP